MDVCELSISSVLWNVTVSTREGETAGLLSAVRRKGWEGKGREGKGREGKGREGKKEGKGREGKGREGKGREGKGREGLYTHPVMHALIGMIRNLTHNHQGRCNINTELSTSTTR